MTVNYSAENHYNYQKIFVKYFFYLFLIQNKLFFILLKYFLTLFSNINS